LESYTGQNELLICKEPSLMKSGKCMLKF
jgi:hypothetical protein